MPRVTDANRIQGRDVPRPEAVDDGKVLRYNEQTQQMEWVTPTGGAGGGGTAAVDGASFAENTGEFTPAGGLFNEGLADVQPGRAATVRITRKRAFHANLRDSAGNEMGIAGVPLVIAGVVSISNLPATQQVTGSVSILNFPVTQPVSGTVSVGNFPATQPVSIVSLPLPAGAAQEHTTAASPLAARLSDGANFLDPRDVSDRAARALGVVSAPALTRGVQGSTGWSVQRVKEAGRTAVFLIVDSIAGIAAEALVSYSGQRGGTALTAGPTAYTVTTGKTFNLQSLVLVAQGSALGTLRVRLRAAPPTVALASPIYAAAAMVTPASGGGASEVVYPEGVEIPGGSQIGISVIGLTTQIYSVLISGHEY